MPEKPRTTLALTPRGDPCFSSAASPPVRNPYRSGLPWRRVPTFIHTREKLRSALHTFERVLWRPPPGINGKDAVGLADEEPLRAELFSVSQLEQHARSLAGWHDVGPGHRAGRGPDRLLPRLRANERGLRDAYEGVTDAVKLGRRVTPAAEWFLDNYHLIEEQIP